MRRPVDQEPLPVPRHNAADPEFGGRLAQLATIPASPRSLQHPRNWVAGARLFVDYALTVPPRVNRIASRIRHHPDPFVKHTIRMPDGVSLKAWLALQPKAASPALIIIPGLFTSKDNAVVKKRARRVYEDWGFHVLTLDLRGNGESDRVPSTAGWKEADDLVEVSSWLRRQAPVQGVGVYAESLAATAAVLAAARAADRDLPFAERGVLAVSGFGDIWDTLEHYTNPPRDNRQVREVVNFFNFLLRLSGNAARNFRQYHELGSRFYGLDPTEAAERSNPANALRRLRDPVLMLHSHDDTLVPVRQLQGLAPTVARVDRFATWLLPWGHHCLYEMAEPRWFWRMLAMFFDAPGRDGTGAVKP